MKSIITILSIVFFLLLTQLVAAQKFIQLELPGDPIVNKYFVGSSIVYKLIDYPNAVSYTHLTLPTILLV